MTTMKKYVLENLIVENEIANGALEEIKASMVRVGQISPVLLASDGRTVIDGASRVLAARQLGWMDILGVIAEGTRLDLLAESENRRQMTVFQRLALEVYARKISGRKATNREIQKLGFGPNYVTAVSLASEGNKPELLLQIAEGKITVKLAPVKKAVSDDPENPEDSDVGVSPDKDKAVSFDKSVTRLCDAVTLVCTLVHGGEKIGGCSKEIRSCVESLERLLLTE